MNQILFRRKALDSYDPTASTNAGLWLDKYLLDDKEDAKKNLVYQVVEKIKISEAYGKFYDKWKSELNTPRVKIKEAETLGRLAINLGADSTLENSIALNRTYGVPYIPGSALKGLAANYARKSIENFDDKIHADIFGTQDNAGYVTFFDALYVPKKELGLVTDVVTVHHQEYYQKEDVPPADWDSPIPIHFLSVSGNFSIALAGPDNLVQATFDILALALAKEGIGAKTNSGYGRMQLEGYEVKEKKPAIKKKSDTPQEIPAGYQSGIVKKVFDSYAFIQPTNSGKDIFAHFNDLADGLKSLKEKQKVFFKTKAGKKLGEVQAIDVRLAE